jgi:formylglycine-generating enzyme required for sulfatase activity
MAPNDKLLNFDLLLHVGDDGYVARVIDSPVGSASASFVLPVSFDRLAAWLADIEALALDGGDSVAANRSAQNDARELGALLYAALFSGPVEMALIRSHDSARAQHQGLRLRLQIASDAAELAIVPWEYLFSSTWNRHIALSTTTPLVRYIEVAQAPQSLAVTPPLQVLAVISDPQGVPPLNVEREWQQLQDALTDLQSARKVIVERLAAPTYVGLQQRLSAGPVHIVHFIGHGYFDQQWGTGGLVLEDEQGQSHSVDAAQLGPLLHDHDALRLAFLNACEGARVAGGDLFAGVAQYLVQQGVPAVIAMQFAVSDDAAIALTRTFYGALANGAPVDSALTEARKAIFGTVAGAEWATPVLFSRSPDADLFEMPAGDTRLTIARQPWEPETILIDAAEFIMGSAPGDGIPGAETPAHSVFLPAYRIGLYPVTNEEYAAFLAHNTYHDQPSTSGWFLREPPPGQERHPVTGVSWHDAMAYCQWLSQATGRRYRLPTEAEWEKAARGKDGHRYPWGNEWDDARVNRTGEAAPVDAIPQGGSPFGVLDLIGNVQEWTQTLWGSESQNNLYPYPYRADDGREEIDVGGRLPRAYRVHRGGSFKDKPADLYAGRRRSSDAKSALAWRGFRIVMEMENYAPA